MSRSFDGTSSEYLEIDSTPITAAPFAISCWVKTAGVSGGRVAVYIGDKDASNHYWTLGTDGSGSSYQANADIRSNFGTVSISSTSDITLSAWQHICFIEAGATDHRVFLNGGSEGSSSTNRSPSGADRVSIGRRADVSPSSYFTGEVAEVAIWDLSNWAGATDALKADEFERVALSALTLGYTPAHFPLGLSSYWPLIQDTDQDIVGGYDLSAHNSPTVETHAPVIMPAWVVVSPPSVGDEFFQSLAGAVSFSGDQTVKAGQGQTGAVTFAGDNAYKVGVNLVGAISFNGGVIRKALQVLSGVLTSGGGTVLKTGQALVGAVTFNGSKSYKIGQSLLGSISFSGSVSSLTFFAKSLAGAVAFNGVIARKAKQSQSGAVTFTGGVIQKTSQTLTGSLSPSGIVARKISQVKAGGVTFVGLIERKAQQVKSGAVSFVGGFTRKTSQTITGAIAFATTQAKKMTHSLTGAITFTGTLARKTKQGITGALSFAGSISASLTISVKTIALTLRARSTNLSVKARSTSLTLRARSVAMTLKTRATGLTLRVRSTILSLLNRE